MAKYAEMEATVNVSFEAELASNEKKEAKKDSLFTSASLNNEEDVRKE